MNYTKALIMCAAVGVTAVGVLAIAPPASGENAPVYVFGREDIVVRHVSYADLNLASAAGEITLNRRVGAAVNDLCIDATGGNDGSTRFKYSMSNCSTHAWNDARPQISRAVERAREMAATGGSSIVAAAVTISLPQ
jgi:UrcA family protein